MATYDVSFVCEVNFHIEADTEEDAIDQGYAMISAHTANELYFDCNECYEMDE